MIMPRRKVETGEEKAVRLLEEMTLLPLENRIAIQLHLAGVKSDDITRLGKTKLRGVPEPTIIRMWGLLRDLEPPYGVALENCYTKKLLKIAQRTEL